MVPSAIENPGDKLGAAVLRRPVAILSYHHTETPPPRGTPVRSLFLPPWRFALQMQLLRLLGWTGLSMRDLEPYLRGEKSGKVFGITLDDGYVSNFEFALPVLRDCGFTATLYVVTGEIGGTNSWDIGKGAPMARLMSREQLAAWTDAGMELGAHTRRHVNLCECDDATALDEIRGSRQDLEDALGVEVRSFCYPYGEHRARHAEMVRAAGFASGTTIVSSRARPDDDPMRLPRISVHLYDSLPLLLAQVTTDFEDWRMGRPNRRTQPNSRWYHANLDGAGAG